MFTDEMSEACANFETRKKTFGDCDVFPHFNITYSGRYHDKLFSPIRPANPFVYPSEIFYQNNTCSTLYINM